nr:MAG TPA: hypothetical protein [Bacteriophage sp.]
MKVLLDIPEEFEVDYNTDRFRDFFKRAKADMDVMCGTYERETADVLVKAFEKSRTYDPDKVVAELERKKFIEQETILSDIHQGFNAGLSAAIQIVKGGGVDGN